MLEKTTRMNYLFDFYQALLTEKQRNYMSLYYLDDYSLGEIAEQFQVSRQAVYDTIKRTEVVLEEYETKLLLFDKFSRRLALLRDLKADLNRRQCLDDNIDALLTSVEQLDLD